jgi:hypothetical protein
VETRGARVGAKHGCVHVAQVRARHAGTRHTHARKYEAD